MFRNEAMLQARFLHKNIVSIHAVSLAPLALALDLCSGGELRDFLSNKEVKYSWSLLLKIASDIAEGLRYLHSNNPRFVQCRMSCIFIYI